MAFGSFLSVNASCPCCDSQKRLFAAQASAKRDASERLTLHPQEVQVSVSFLFYPTSAWTHCRHLYVCPSADN